MSQGSLITDSAADVSHVEPDHQPATDLRHAMMTLPVQQQNLMLDEFRERRDNFRRWLMQQLEEGKHYGVPPGCEPKRTDPRQWQAQPSLYAAGADLLCDLLALRAEYKADVEAWQQLGSKPGYVVMICRLFSRSNNILIGEGRGARKEGQKGGDLNNAIKMAQKSAKVDAVLNSYGLRDMFTQDLENPAQPPHDNPEPDQDAPKAAPRGQRTDLKAVVDRVKLISETWKDQNPNVFGEVSAWSADYKRWVMAKCDRVFNPQKPAEWTAADMATCERALGIEVQQ